MKKARLLATSMFLSGCLLSPDRPPAPNDAAASGCANASTTGRINMAESSSSFYWTPPSPGRYVFEIVTVANRPTIQVTDEITRQRWSGGGSYGEIADVDITVSSCNRLEVSVIASGSTFSVWVRPA